MAGQCNACCGGAAVDGQCDPIAADLSSTDQTAQVPEAALRASLGCGNPTALAALSLGEVVLDLGSGGGIDGGIAGALQDTTCRASLDRVGFEAIDIEPTRVDSVEAARAFLTAEGLDAAALTNAVDGPFMSVSIRARKPIAPAGVGE